MTTAPKIHIHFSLTRTPATQISHTKPAHEAELGIKHVGRHGVNPFSPVSDKAQQRLTLFERISTDIAIGPDLERDVVAGGGGKPQEAAGLAGIARGEPLVLQVSYLHRKGPLDSERVYSVDVLEMF